MSRNECRSLNLTSEMAVNSGTSTTLGGAVAFAPAARPRDDLVVDAVDRHCKARVGRLGVTVADDDLDFAIIELIGVPCGSLALLGIS